MANERQLKTMSKAARRRAARRRPAVLALLFALLWTQLAIAAYACPMMLQPMQSMSMQSMRSTQSIQSIQSIQSTQSTHSTEPTQASSGGLSEQTAATVVPPDCHPVAAAAIEANGPDTPDAPAPAVCVEHCRQGDQHADSTGSTLAAPATAPDFLLTEPPAPGLAPSTAPLQSLLVRATSPPIAIAHCCFRI
jgi:hypothetical protein